MDVRDLFSYLWNEKRILTAAIKHAEFQGLRISPSVYTTQEELDRFCDTMIDAEKHGVPAIKAGI